MAISTPHSPHQHPARLLGKETDQLDIGGNGQPRACVPAVDVGLVYSGEVGLARALIRSLAFAANGLPYRLIVVDNDSSDDLTAILPPEGEVHVVRNECRQTYAANLNRILAHAQSRYVLLLNTDIYFDANEPCLQKMVEFMEDHPECSVAGCRIYRPDGAYAFPARRFPTLPMILARRLPGSNWFRESGRRHLYAERNATESYSCDWLSGCLLMVRRRASVELGAFDERFQRYFEDVDFCQRMASPPWKVMFHGATYCFHHEQRASRRLCSRAAWTHLKSYAKWLLKRRRNIRRSRSENP